ncbi:MAG: DNA gyrase inhibitor YacG [Deltaproteobacteria bacterium]|nr:DNA gyrase inhibitor YacG [Deltaproteobacteria bacterium]
MRKLFCLHCQKPIVWEDNLWRPFCSERCKMIDLGHWFAGDYALPGGEKDPAPSNEEASSEEEKPTLH